MSKKGSTKLPPKDKIVVGMSRPLSGPLAVIGDSAYGPIYETDRAASPDNMQAFALAKGFEKCSLLPGIGARLAAEIIIESLE